MFKTSNVVKVELPCFKDQREKPFQGSHKHLSTNKLKEQIRQRKVKFTISATCRANREKMVRKEKVGKGHLNVF